MHAFKTMWEEIKEMTYALDNCKWDIIISSVAVYWIGMDVRMKYGDSTLKAGQNFSTSCQLVPFYAFTLSIQLLFAADWKQLAKSSPADVCS